jgi:hypothetical protein
MTLGPDFAPEGWCAQRKRRMLVGTEAGASCDGSSASFGDTGGELSGI